MVEEQKDGLTKNEEASAALEDEIKSEGDSRQNEGDDEHLSDDEIQSLLGGDEESGIQPSDGIKALISKKNSNYEKFPMLEVLFERFATSISTRMRNFSGETADIKIENITSIGFDDYLNSIPLPALIPVFHAVEWENSGIMNIDSDLIYSLIDILLGGKKGDSSFQAEDRVFTAIEQDIIKSFSRIVFDEMAQAFSPIAPVSFRLDKLESNPKFATITRPQNPVVIISFRIAFDSTGGKVDIVLPYSTIEPIRSKLTQMFSGESFGSDISWESFLTDEIKSTDIILSAKLKPKKIMLKELSELRVGKTIITNNEIEDLINVSCNGIPVFNGILGAKKESFAISIKDYFDMKDIV